MNSRIEDLTQLMFGDEPLFSTDYAIRPLVASQLYPGCCSRRTASKALSSSIAAALGSRLFVEWWGFRLLPT